MTKAAKNSLILAIIILVIIILTALGYIYFIDKKIKEPVVENFIFYEKNNQIWKVDLKTEKEEQVAIGTKPSISPDKSKLVYTYKSETDELSEIHILDIKTNIDKVLKKYTDHFAIAVYEAIWSPDGKYLLVDKGTSPIRTKMVIDSRTGEDIISFTAYSSNCEWLDNDEIVYSEPQGTLYFRPYGAGQGLGITIINIDGQKKILKQATLNEDYMFEKVLNNKIYFTSTIVESNEDWDDIKKQNVSYWFMNKNGDNLIQVEK